MRKFENLLGILAGLAGLGTAGLAIVVVGNLFMADDTTPAASRFAVVEPNQAIVEIEPATEAAAQTVTEAAVQAVSPAETEAEIVVPVAASGEPNIKDGAKIYKKCKACHTVDEGGKSGTGPNLWDIVGSDVAVTEGFSYSDAMLEFGGSWTVERLDVYLTKPRDLVPGTKMSFSGLRKEADRQSVILYLAQNAPTPQSAADLGFGGDAAPAAEAAEDTAEEVVEAVEIEEIPYADGVVYANPPERSDEETAAIAERVAALEALAPTLDYERARHHPLHFPPAITEASNEECLVCHQEILDHKPLEASPAGVPVAETIAWYQTLDTYLGEQESFHFRHLESDYAKAVMNMECAFCHKGNDPREESPDMMTGRPAFSAAATPEFTLRKMVNPSETCLRCHGAMPDTAEIMGFEGPWHVAREDMEWPEAPNGCMSCHAESFRTVRHNVTYLNAANIEELGRWGSSDSCYGCHGGRSWYSIQYPYPRHEWPEMIDMVGEEVPEWAVGRPTESDPAYALPAATE